MPSLNINTLFSDRKKCTVPEYAIPQNVKQALCIDAVHADGTFKIEPGSGTAMYDQCYLFEDVNYINKDEQKKTRVLLELMRLFKGMNGQFKITVASEQHDMDAFFKEVFHPVHTGEYPVVEEGIGQWICQKIDEGTRDIRRTLLLTVTCRAKSFAEADTYFGSLDTTLSLTFHALKSRIYRLGATERLKVIQRIMRAGADAFPVSEEMVTGSADGWKDQVMPASIVSEEDYLKIGARYATVLFAHDYDQTLNEEKVMHGLTDVNFPVYVTLDMEPVPKRILKDRLLAAHANNEKSMAQENDRNKRNGQYLADNSYGLKAKKKEIEALIEQVDENDEEALFLGLLVMVAAESLEELSRRADTLMQVAAGNGFTLEPYYHQQLKALNTVCPIGGRQVNHMRSFVTSSAVAFQPFYAKDLQDGDFIYGLNTTTKQLLRGDRKKLPAAHGIIVGHTGTGKSMFIKSTEVAQTILGTDDNAVALDPNNEMQAYITMLRGSYFDMTPQSCIYMNPFEVPRYVKEGDETLKNKFVAKMVEYASSFCAAVMTNITVTQVHINYIGRAVRKMYADYFEKNTGRRAKEQPTLVRMREILKEDITHAEYREDRRILLDIVDSLELYTEGAYDMFAHPSNITMDNRLIGFGLKNLPESVWEAAMLTVMHFLTMRIEANQEEHVALRLIVDEAQVLCARPSTAAQLLHAVETYRKVGAIVTLAVQNLTRVLENEALRDMFSNCPFKCFFDLGGIDAVNLSAIQELSERELAQLENPETGHGLLSWNGQVFLFDCYMSHDNPLYPLISTNFHEKAAEYKKKNDESVETEEEDLKERNGREALKELDEYRIRGQGNEDQ